MCGHSVGGGRSAPGATRTDLVLEVHLGANARTPPPHGGCASRVDPRATHQCRREREGLREGGSLAGGASKLCYPWHKGGSETAALTKFALEEGEEVREGGGGRRKACPSSTLLDAQASSPLWRRQAVLKAPLGGLSANQQRCRPKLAGRWRENPVARQLHQELAEALDGGARLAPGEARIHRVLVGSITLAGVKHSTSMDAEVAGVPTPHARASPFQLRRQDRMWRDGHSASMNAVEVTRT